MMKQIKTILSGLKLKKVLVVGNTLTNNKEWSEGLKNATHIIKEDHHLDILEKLKDTKYDVVIINGKRNCSDMIRTTNMLGRIKAITEDSFVILTDTNPDEEWKTVGKERTGYIGDLYRYNASLMSNGRKFGLTSEGVTVFKFIQDEPTNLSYDYGIYKNEKMMPFATVEEIIKGFKE